MFSLSACNNKQPGKNFLFDMGTKRFPTDTSFIKITEADNYDVAKGFGWIKAPTGSFDSSNEKLPMPLLHDGVMSADSMVFRVDMPDGDYFMRLTIGTPGPDTTRMLVTVNGEVMTDTVTTPWYRISYRTLRQKISINDRKAVIKVAALSKGGAGIYGIEFRPVTNNQSISFSTILSEDTIETAAFARSLQKKIDNDPTDINAINQLQIVNDYLLACYYFDGGGWSWATKKTGMSLFVRMYAAADLLEPIVVDKNDPLYERSLYLLAKIYYWLNEEDDVLYHSIKFHYYFSILKNKYPEDTLLRMYTGEKIFDPPAFDTTAGNAPKWAVYQRETMKRMLKKIDWWVNKKQIDNGEMGGKYGDDVELLRWWLPAIFGADDSTARKGYIRLADGVWNSDVLERGFAKRIDDVEHSAELFRDTHPAMFLMNYGDPEYVERCLVSMQNFRDVWTGITPLGHLHFKSYYLSATGVLSNTPFGVDVALNARAILPGLWAAWYNHNPTLIKLFSKYSNSWIADADRTDNGKPAGLMPSAIGFAQDRIGGDSKDWYDGHLTYDYYQWDHIGHVGELQSHLVGMYGVTKNPHFLKTLNEYAELMKIAEKQRKTLSDNDPGSLDWAKYLLIRGGIDHEVGNNPMGKLFSMAKSLTNTTEYDSLIALYGEAYNRYQITHDKEEISKGFEEILSALRYNWPLSTSEVKFTDRVYMPGSDLLMGMYTGHFGAGYEYPSLIATWKNTGPDVSIFVHKGDQRSAVVSLYNFGNEKQVKMQTWKLEPGIYTIKQGTDNNDDDIPDADITEQTVELTERMNSINLVIPSKKETVLIIEQIKSLRTANADEADVAINSNDIYFSDSVITDKTQTTINCKVHNIGSKAAKNTIVEFFVDNKKVSEKIIPVIQAPLDLNPRSVIVSFAWIPVSGIHTISIKITSVLKEITLQNNQAGHSVNVP